MEIQQFIEQVLKIARENGYRIETNRDGLAQIDFGNKKLHAGHLRAVFPEIMEDGAAIAEIIERAAPGRPCAHKPMKEIIGEIRNRRRDLKNLGIRENAGQPAAQPDVRIIEPSRRSE
jgi:hypothetical protein